MSSLPQLDAIATLLNQGAADSAVRLLRSCWEPDLPPDDLVRMYCMWVRGLCETGELDHALTLARRAASEFPREPDVLIALGNVQDLVGDLEKAREAFEAAIDQDPGGGLQHYNLGAVLERLGREMDAEVCYRRANECDPHGGMYEAIAALGALLRRQGRLEEAEQIYDLYLSDDSINVEILVEHGICLSDLDRLDEAIDRFDFALSLDPENAGAQYNKAITLYRLGRYEQALNALERARQLDKGNALTLAVLGGWRLSAADCDLDEALGLLYGALDLLERRYAQDPGQIGYCSLVAEEIFEALWQNGRQGEAREVARLAGQREWITPHILDCLNEADHGRSPQVSMYTVVARAEAGERPEHWPENTDGYTTGLTVLATDENEAREFCMQYLRTIEPSPDIRFTLDVVPPQSPSDPSPSLEMMAELRGAMQPRPRGVARVHGQRSYIFRT
ncbi:Tetratricopeptide (TPR) repeat [Nannocystis exedens]|uniref:Tetratricopeptide (TPR) repeat n=1 Tax=Nannocystis exedens TaxID=54 RepID=A0A1I2FRA0_9BACT|nr:tetratricopeptide repeat protein [Nannocystis exedens]PCC74534.1 lipoprotein NlpI [Nannocystis exedens]SFF07277.1 Tetratricopeptide (TPR) repeat [Nannocystis exedens]